MASTTQNDRHADDADRRGRAPISAPHRAAQERYRPELDGIRALCIVFTILNHVPAVRWINGSVGVDVFFALSGWLITTLLLREEQESGCIALRPYFIRRGFRILPLYVLTVVAYGALSFAGVREGAAEDFKASLIWFVTFCVEYRPAEVGHIFTHAWTLGIEEKFYLAWPLILVLTARKPERTALVGAAGIAVMLALTPRNDFVLRGYLGLGAGAALSYAAMTQRRFRNWLRERAVAAPFLAIMAAAYLGSITLAKSPWWNIAISWSAAFVIATLWFRRDLPTARFLSWGPLPALGRLTYAIYLFQFICIHAMQAVLSALGVPAQAAILFATAYPLSIGVAVILHRHVERPFIRLGKQIAGRQMPRPGHHRQLAQVA